MTDKRADGVMSPLEIVQAFQQRGWKNNDPMGQVLRLRQEDPQALGELVQLFLDRGLEHATFIDAALDLMDDATHADVLRQAWQRSRRFGTGSGLSEVLDCAATQCPEVFADDWDHLLAAAHQGQGGPRFGVDLAWRALDADTARAWLAEVGPRAEEGSLEYLKARAVLHSRHPDLVLEVWRRVFAPQDESTGIYWLMAVGYADDNGQARALHGEQPLHIRFSAAQRKLMLASQPAWRRDIQRLHPTWGAVNAAPPVSVAASAAASVAEKAPQADAPAVAVGRMGGTLTATCGLCHGPLHRLLALPQPALAGIDCATPLEFATCLACQGWEADAEVLFFQHDGQGAPQAHPSQRRDDPLVPEFPTGPLLEADVTLFQAPKRWTWQDWGDSNGRQNLSRVGGPPSWVQQGEYPPCPDCDTRMAFAMQLDSDLPQEDGGEWSWGSGGCNYTFWCAHCRVSGHLWQCT